MRTTVDIPDALFKRAKIRAAMDGVAFKEIMRMSLEQWLAGNGAAAAKSTPGRELPSVPAKSPSKIPLFTNREIEQIMDLEDSRISRERS